MTDFKKVIFDYWDSLILFVLVLIIWQNYGSDSERMINLILLSLGAFAIEKAYVSRSTILPNVLAIYFIFSSVQLPDVLSYYLLLGILIGVLSLYCYLKTVSLPNYFYGLVYPFYSLKTILAFYSTFLLSGLGFNISWWVTFIFILIAIWVFAVKRLGNESPFTNLA